MSMRSTGGISYPYAKLKGGATPPATQDRWQFWLGHAAVPAVLTLLLYAYSEKSTIDLQISQWLFEAGGGKFIDNWILERVMHKGARSVGRIMGFAMILSLLASLFWQRMRPARMPLLFIVTSVMLGSSTVVKFKHLTDIYCPSQLSIFGGDMPLLSPFDTSHWRTDHQGQCWPGGHSSFGFALWPFYFIAREYRPALAPWVFTLVFVYGNFLGSIRVIQGAHFLSHQWWTAVICWLITFTLYVFLLRRDLLPGNPSAKEPARQTSMH